MKLLRILSSATFLFIIYVSLSTPLSGCQKTTTVHDTTTVIIKDTTIIKDTLTLNDTIYNITSGLVAYYNFNGGNLNDSSGYNNNIVFNNATLTTDRLGNPNNAYLFDGSTSYMQVPNSISLNPNNISIFAIVKPTAFNTTACHSAQVLGKLSQDDENGIYLLRLNDTTGTCNGSPLTSTERFFGAYGDNNNPYGSDIGAGPYAKVNVQLGQWYSLAFTFDGTIAKMFVNGQLVDSLQKTILFSANTDDLYIGKTPNPSFPFFFTGVIDEIRIYNTAITPNQVKALDMLKTKYLKYAGKVIY